MSNLSSTSSDSTLVLQRGPQSDSTPLVDSVCQSTTFVQQRISDDVDCSYSRVSNPTVNSLEHTLGLLEDAPPSVCFSSGLAAETALFLALLSSGDHVVLSQAIYGGTVRLIRDVLSRFGIEATFVDSSQVELVETAIQPNTKLVFVETPANPILVLTDIEAIARVTKRHNILLAVDNTFLTPVGQRPLELGADISVYSTTKHIEGHSSAVGGAITSKNESILEQLRWIRKSTGAIQTPQNAWVTSRGLKTLPIRFQRHCESALVIARQLQKHDRICTVNYPGLDDFAQSNLASKQHRCGHGGVISFEIQGGFDTARAFLGNVKLCALVEHVGAVDTLLTHPASMTHADVPQEQLAAVGLTPGLLRLSVGLEEPEDILNDIFSSIDLISFRNSQFESNGSLQRGVACPVA